MKISNWVYGMYGKDKVTGFIVDEKENSFLVCGTLYQDNKILEIKKDKLWNHEDILIGQDELLSLVDLALDIRDEEWFHCLVQELKQWKAVGDIEGLE